MYIFTTERETKKENQYEATFGYPSINADPSHQLQTNVSLPLKAAFTYFLHPQSQ